MKIKITVTIVGLLLLFCNKGYCLFPAETSPAQVRSAVRIQRAKDEQRKKQAQKLKKEEERPNMNEQDPVDQAKTQTYGGKTAESIAAKQQEQSEDAEKKIQYKRYNRQGQVVPTAAPKTIPQPDKQAAKPEEKKSNKGIVLFLIIAALAAAWKFRNKKQ